MNRWLYASVTVLCLSAPASAETLRERSRAYATNPQLAAAGAGRDARTGARARPTLSAGMDAGYDQLGFGRAGSASVVAALPIWTGGRVRSAVRAANADLAAGG